MNSPPAPVTAGRRLDGKVALVTGGGSGIGRAVCRTFAAAGAVVIVVDLNSGSAGAVAAELRLAGTQSLECQADVSEPEDVSAAIERTLDAFGRIDVLVNNAGLAIVQPLLEHDLATWKRAFAVNVEGALLFTQKVARVMKAQDPCPLTGCRGKILNMSSGAADVGRPLLASYGASKAALNHLSKSTAVVLEPELIATTVIYPTTVADGMWSTLGHELADAEGRDADDLIRERIASTPSGRFQTAEEVGAIALYAATWKGMGLNGRLIWSEAHIATL